MEVPRVCLEESSATQYENVERVAGETKRSFWKLFRYALDGIIEYTNMPLSVAMWAGGGLFAVTGVLLVIMLGCALLGKPLGMQVLLITVVLFMCGAILLASGILGEYLAKTYDEVRKRPHYIIRDRYE